MEGTPATIIFSVAEISVIIFLLRDRNCVNYEEILSCIRTYANTLIT